MRVGVSVAVRVGVSIGVRGGVSVAVRVGVSVGVRVGVSVAVRVAVATTRSCVFAGTGVAVATVGVLRTGVSLAVGVLAAGKNGFNVTLVQLQPQLPM